MNNVIDRGDVEIVYGDQAVWVNNSEGCLGRFGRRGIDVHTTITAQENGAPQCLFCTHDRVVAADWQRFTDAMFKYHQIDMRDQALPIWLTDPDV